jgi:hypothetical protein
LPGTKNLRNQAKDFGMAVVYLYEEHKAITMKKLLGFTACLFVLNMTPAFGQPVPAPPPQSPAPFQTRLHQIVKYEDPNAPQPPALTQFSLDFPGGSPSELVAAIEKALGKPLNVIINHEDEDVSIPPLKMNNVTMPQLFKALEAVSRKTVAVSTSSFPNGGGGFNSYSQFVSSYGFTTDDNPVTDTSVWYFHEDRPSLPPIISTQKACKFYSLSVYLDRGFSVDDITTAIQTGWKLSAQTDLPELNYHKETKLLIAYGDPDKLKTIDQVLIALPNQKAVHSSDTWDQVTAKIQKLQEEFDQLKNEAHASTNSSPGAGAPVEEKTGK